MCGTGAQAAGDAGAAVDPKAAAWSAASRVPVRRRRSASTLVQQALLHSVELLAAGTELPTLEDRDLMSELVDARVAPDELAILHQDLTVGVRQSRQ